MSRRWPVLIPKRQRQAFLENNLFDLVVLFWWFAWIDWFRCVIENTPEKGAGEDETDE